MTYEIHVRPRPNNSEWVEVEVWEGLDVETVPGGSFVPYYEVKKKLQVQKCNWQLLITVLSHRYTSGVTGKRIPPLVVVELMP